VSRAEADDRRILVVGIGNPDRADDAIGPAVLGLVAEQLALRALGARARPTGGSAPRAPLPPCRLVVLPDPMRLVDELDGCELAIVVDAVVAAGPGAQQPGAVLLLGTGQGQPALPVAPDPTAGGTHGLGLPAALELARALGRMPDRVAVVGVVAQQLAPGAPMSAQVRAAIPTAAMQVVGLLATEAAADALHPGDPPPWLPHPVGTLDP
jgi:hydrogenase maturation protease